MAELRLEAENGQDEYGTRRTVIPDRKVVVTDDRPMSGQLGSQCDEAAMGQTKPRQRHHEQM